MSDKVIIGRFGKVYGIHGWLKVISYTDPPEQLLSYANWLLKKNNHWQPLVIEASRPPDQGLIVKIKGYDSPEEARLLTNKEIAIQFDQLPKLPAGEFYWHDLIGLSVITINGVDLGKIVSLLETGANSVLIVEGERERLIPYIKDVVKSVDLHKGTVVVDWDPEF